MHDVEIIEDPAAAAVALCPVRTRLLAELVDDGRPHRLIVTAHPKPEETP